MIVPLARIHPSLMGDRPDLVYDSTLWDAAIAMLEERRAGLDAVEEGMTDEVVGILRICHDQPLHWWHFNLRLTNLAKVLMEASPSARGPRTTAIRDALDLLRNGIDGFPLNDRQIEDLAKTLQTLGLVEPLDIGLADVPELGAKHGIVAWREACQEVRLNRQGLESC